MMRYWLLLCCIITSFGHLFAETGHTADTLLFPIPENRDNEIRQDVLPSALFLKSPSNIKDSIVYDL